MKKKIILILDDNGNDVLYEPGSERKWPAEPWSAFAEEVGKLPKYSGVFIVW